MSYDEDLRTLVALEKARLIAVNLALIAVGLSLAFESRLVAVVRVLAWLFAALFGVREARVKVRLGRDPDASYLRAAMFGVLGLVNLYLVTRA